jgi:hypothetical protein
MLALTLLVVGILVFDVLALRFGAETWKQAGPQTRW